MICELAPAKVNLVLRVGPVAPDGLHEVCSLFASLELHDAVEVRESDRDEVACDAVPGPNLAEAAIHAFRAAHPALREILRLEALPLGRWLSTQQACRLRARLFESDSRAGEHLRGGTRPLAQHAEQQVLGSNVRVVQLTGLGHR